MKTSETIRIFNELAADYWLTDYMSFGWTEYIRKRAVKLLDIQANETICDAMCGTANNFRLLAKQECSVIAIDNAVEMMGIAKKQHPAGNIHFRLEDFMNNTLPENSVDKLICTFGLKSLKEEEYNPFISQIQRILKPNGSFVVADFYLQKSSLLHVPVLWYIKYMVPFINLLFTRRNPHRYLYTFASKSFNLDLFLHCLDLKNISYNIQFTGLKQGIILQGKVS